MQLTLYLQGRRCRNPYAILLASGLAGNERVDLRLESW